MTVRRPEITENKERVSPAVRYVYGVNTKFPLWRCRASEQGKSRIPSSRVAGGSSGVMERFGVGKVRSHAGLAGYWGDGS